MSIPKIIHQIWIGPKPKPTKFMDTWKEKNPDFEYICWSEEEIEKRQFVFKCQEKIDEIEEINGKADILRWEILYKYGGVFLDADSICIEPIDDELLNKKCFAGWEQEEVREGLIATGTIGFPPEHPLVKAAISWILNNEVSQKKAGLMAWQSVGPGLLTRMYNTGLFKDLHIFPSYAFLPIHLTGREYKGHGKVYAFQAWGSTKQSYEKMNEIELPQEFMTPSEWVSVLIPCFNTKYIYIKECLESIKNQNGYFGIEVVFINDGSNLIITSLLERELKNFEINTRFTSVKYIKMEENKGITFCLREGVKLCSHENIIRMDSDDIMMNNRIITQLEFMKSNNDCVICGSNVQLFKTFSNYKEKTFLQNTNHPYKITWNDYKKTKSHWFMNHPSLCYKKSAVLSAGNYNIREDFISEDLELELRILKKYGVAYNIQESLLQYRIHEDQITYNANSLKENQVSLRNKVIDEIINE
jgi:hypothetical protein